MNIYSFSSATREFTGAGTADPDPMAPGEFLMPALSTTVTPPAVLLPKQAAVFDDVFWSVVVDRRGETWFAVDGAPVLIADLGDPALQGLLEDQPPPLPVEVDAGVTPPRMVASALSIAVADGDISSVEGIYGLAGAIYLDVGQYMLLFLNSQPDTNFFAVINGGAPCMAAAEKNVDYLIIQATAAAGGEPVDPAQFNVQVFRV